MDIAPPAVRTVMSPDGTRIAYEPTGSGPPLVVVTGAMGYRASKWMRDYAQAFAAHFTVYNYDRRGRGDSTDTQPYAVAREVEDLAAVAQAAGGRPYVFGLSSGAALALEAAAAGVPMAALIAYEPPYMLEDAKNPPAPDFEAHLQRLVAEGKRDEAVSYFMRTVGVPRVVVAVMRLFPFWKGLRSTAHTLPYDAAVMGGFKIPTQRLATVRVPTFVVNGTKSPEQLQKSAAAVARAVPQAQHRTLAKQNHGVKPAAIAPLVAEIARPGAPTRKPAVVAAG